MKKSNFYIDDHSALVLNVEPKDVEHACQLMIEKYEFIKKHYRQIRRYNHLENCAGCVMFSGFTDHPCVGCPVQEFIGAKGCHDTPFGDFESMSVRYKYDPSKESKERFLRAIDNEILFLREVYAEWLRNKINEELKGKV